MTEWAHATLRVVGIPASPLPSAAPALRCNSNCYQPLDENVAANVAFRKYFDLLHNCHAVWLPDTNNVKKRTDTRTDWWITPLFSDTAGVSRFASPESEPCRAHGTSARNSVRCENLELRQDELDGESKIAGHGGAPWASLCEHDAIVEAPHSFDRNTL